ncbi:hypothetical protein BGU33_05270 [Clostridioides difficile]|nr:hypothetical protein [Clostridioides difficile]PBE90002.1 hypothetical protein BGU33_05270 [Clostridioides difficile]
MDWDERREQQQIDVLYLLIRKLGDQKNVEVQEVKRLEVLIVDMKCLLMLKLVQIKKESEKQ